MISRNPFRNFLLKPFLLLSVPITVLSLLLLGGKTVFAQPIIPANDGTGTIVSPDGNTFNIGGGSLSPDQANLFHSFQKFGLNPDQIANFLSQPHIRNILGRVVGGDPSVIQGLIRVSGGTSNLYLMNPSGIVFGPTARLDVPANFSATTATSIQFDREFFNSISSNNYSALSGNPNAYVFSSQTGNIINAGELKLEPGKVLTLIANTVTNTGEISSEGGQVILASMPKPGVVRLSQPGQVLSVEYQVGEGASLPTDSPEAISVADLSQILNQTQDYDLGFTLNPDGSVQLSVSPIKIAPNPGTTIASGTINVSGATGGQVSVLGETVAVVGANINASGSNGGGGVVHMGGELQGQGTTPTAQRTVVDSTSVINVDAVDQGNGGEAIVWADGRTDFAGTITAKGGVNGGDGGFVEVSGKDSLGFTGTVDTTAAKGHTGTLLLDPTDILIVDGSFGSGDSEFSILVGTVASTYTPSSSEPFTIAELTIESFLSSSNVSLAATNNITIADLTDDTLGLSSSSIGNLTLTADADNSGAGSVSMNSGDRINIPGNINLSGASLTLGGLQSLETINLNATNGDISLNGFVFTNGNLTMTAQGNVNSNSSLSSGGAVNINSQGAINTNSIFGNGVTLTAGGNITARDSISSGAGQNLSLTSSAGAIDTTAGSLSTSASSGTTGKITLDAAGDIRTSSITTRDFGSGSSGIISSVNSGSIQLTSRAGSIDTNTSSGGISSGSSSGTGGNVTLQAAQNITVTTIETQSTVANSGNLQMTATNGNIVLADGIRTTSFAPFGRAGDITFSSGGTIDASDEINFALGNAIDELGNSYTLEASAISGVGSTVNLTATGDITLGLIDTSGNLGGGNITMNSTGGKINAIVPGIPITGGSSTGTVDAGILYTSSNQGSGGAVKLSAAGNVVVGSILSGSTNGFGGNVELSSTNGSVTAISSGTLNSSSGVSQTRSAGGIVTGTTGNGQGGSITITAPGDIRTGWLITGSSGGNFSSSLSEPSSLRGGGNVSLTSSGGGIDTTINVTGIDASLLVDLGLTSAQATLASQAGTELGMIITGSQDGNGGTVNLNAARDIRTGAIVSGSVNGAGGAVTLTSSGGSIDTSNDAFLTGFTRSTWLEAASAAGLAATDTIDFAQDLGFGSGTYSVDQLATILDGFSFRLGITTGGSTGGNVSLTAPGNITTSNILTTSLNGSSGNITITSSGGIINGQEGVLLSGISANLLQSLELEGDLATVLEYFSRPDVAFGGYITLSLTGNAGNLALTAGGDVLTNYLAASSFSGRPGNININSGGNVVVGRLFSNVANGIFPAEFSSLTDDRADQLAQLISRGVLNSSGATSGGEITVKATTSITTGAVNSSSTQGSGSNVLLDPSGDIEVYSINTQGGTQLGFSSSSSAIRGGSVTIATESDFRALGSFTDQNGINASISTAAPGGGGRISITHGGGGRTPFTLGQALSSGSGNGVVGAITSGNFTIFPYNIDPNLAASLANGNPFLIAPEAGYRFTQRFPGLGDGFDNAIGAIGIFFVDQPDTICQGDNCNPPPKQTCQDLGNCPIIGPGQSRTPVLSIDEARDILALIEQRSGIKPALIYVSFESPEFELRSPADQFTQDEFRYSEQYEKYLNVPDRVEGAPLNLEPSGDDILQLMVVTSSEDPFLIAVPGATRDRVVFNAARMLNSINEQQPEGVYLRSSQQLYKQLMEPISAVLEERKVENLVFIMDNSLRLLPVAALHDGEQYLIEKYSVGLMPSLSLTDTRFVDIKEVGLLAMGADTFSDEAPLPAVPTELSVIAGLWNAPDPFLNDRFTLANLRSARANQRYGILHLATHGDFNPGSADQSYIRFGEGRVTLDQLRTLRLYAPTVELMVLSACRTAVGNPEAELGFAGLAHQAGVKTALGSLWYVGDQATLTLMTSFYSSLRNAPIKAEALREAQLAMLRGEVSLENGMINIERGNTEQQFPLRGEAVEAIESVPVNLRHPYAWSAFTMIGSPW